MNTLKYKDFIGSVAFSEEDNVFFGKIEGIEDLVTFEGESVSELKEAFHESVEHYLVFCKEHDKAPHKSYSGALNVRLTPDMHRQVAALSSITGDSINSLIRQGVEMLLTAARKTAVL